MSIATIKYYIREGLLPAAPLKTGRTMGYYDHAYLERLRLIRTLREAHFLPLRVIKAILAERAGEPLGAGEAEALARVAPSVMRTLAGGGEASRDDLKRRYGLSDDELSVLEDQAVEHVLASARVTEEPSDYQTVIRGAVQADRGHDHDHAHDHDHHGHDHSHDHDHDHDHSHDHDHDHHDHDHAGHRHD